MLHSTSRYPCNVRLRKDAWSEHCRNLQRLGDPEFVVGVLVNRADAKPTLRTCHYIRTCALNLRGVARVAAGRFLRCTASGRTGPRERKTYHSTVFVFLAGRIVVAHIARYRRAGHSIYAGTSTSVVSSRGALPVWKKLGLHG